MNDTPLSIRDALARTAVPLAALAAMAALALREVDAVSGAESWYLAILSTAVLLAAAFLARAPAWEAGLGGDACHGGGLGAPGKDRDAARWWSCCSSRC